METLYPWQQRYLRRFAVDGMQTLYLEHISPGTTTISSSTCCHANLVAMATDKYFYTLVFEGA